ETDFEILGHFRTKLSTVHPIGTYPVPAFVSGEKLLAIEVGGHFVQVEKLLAQASILLRASALFVLKLDVEALRERFHRFGESQTLRLHDEGDHIPGVSRAEALVEPLVGR